MLRSRPHHQRRHHLYDGIIARCRQKGGQGDHHQFRAMNRAWRAPLFAAIMAIFVAKFCEYADATTLLVSTLCFTEWPVMNLTFLAVRRYWLADWRC